MSQKGERKPLINFDLPGFLNVVKKKGAEKATFQVLEDMLVMAQKVLSGRKD